MAELFVSLSVPEAENLIKGWMSQVLEANKPDSPESTLPKIPDTERSYQDI